MPERSQTSGGSGIGPVRWRTVAVLIMIAGALGFFAALIAFDEQVLCLTASTILTLAGLGINIYTRRKGMVHVVSDKPAPPPSTSAMKERVRPTRVGRVPPGLRSAAVKTPAQSPILAETSQVVDKASQQAAGSSFLDTVIQVLEQQGATVEVESARGPRSILRILKGLGQVYVAIVLESSTAVGVSEIRGLQSLVSSSGSTRGYFITAGSFTQEAYDWAATRQQIRLVDSSEIEELGI